MKYSQYSHCLNSFVVIGYLELEDMMDRVEEVLFHKQQVHSQTQIDCHNSLITLALHVFSMLPF